MTQHPSTIRFCRDRRFLGTDPDWLMIGLISTAIKDWLALALSRHGTVPHCVVPSTRPGVPRRFRQLVAAIRTTKNPAWLFSFSVVFVMVLNADPRGPILCAAVCTDRLSPKQAGRCQVAAVLRARVWLWVGSRMD